VELTLRGVRLASAPRVPREIRGVVIPWERVGARRLYREDGTHVPLPLRAVRWEEIQTRTARRARERRFRRLIGDGTLDLRIRLDGERRRARQRIVAGALLGVVMLVLFFVLALDRGVLASFGFLEALTMLLMFAIPACYAVAFVVPGLAARRLIASSVRVTGQELELELPDATVLRRAWSSLRRVEWLGLEQYAELVFDDGEPLVLPRHRLDEVLSWHAQRVHPDARASPWKWPAAALLMGQTCALAQIWVIGTVPEAQERVNPLEAYLMWTGVGMLMGGVLWYASRARRRNVR
jgi:hypothetical protein